MPWNTFSKRLLVGDQTEAPKHFPRNELKELYLWFDLWRVMDESQKLLGGRRWSATSFRLLG